MNSSKLNTVIVDVSYHGGHKTMTLTNKAGDKIKVKNPAVVNVDLEGLKANERRAGAVLKLVMGDNSVLTELPKAKDGNAAPKAKGKTPKGKGGKSVKNSTTKPKTSKAKVRKALDKAKPVTTFTRKGEDGKVSIGGEALDLLTNPLAFVANKVSLGHLNKNNLSYGAGQLIGVGLSGLAAGMIVNPVTGLAVGAAVGTMSVLRTKAYREAVAKAAKFVGRQIKRGATWTWKSVIERIWGWICKAAKAVGAAVKWVWNNVIVGMWNRIREFGGFVKDSYNSASDAMKTAYNTAR